jgi:WD40 repeat protein
LVEVWNFKPQIRPFKFVGHKGQVNDVLFNSDSTKVISCGDDREIRIWKNSVYEQDYPAMASISLSRHTPDQYSNSASPSRKTSS